MASVRREIRRRLVRLCAGGGVLAAACGPIKGYTGPTRPLEETALVTVPAALYALRDPAADERTVDDIEVRRAGISLLPGEHSFSFHYMHEAEEEGCTVLVHPEWLGTPWFHGRGWSVPTYPRSRIESACRVVAFETACSGRFTVEPGKRYRLELQTEENRAPSSVSLIRLDGEHTAGTVGRCRSDAAVRMWKRESL